jgi:3-methylfumaryl-CoA hydratase
MTDQIQDHDNCALPLVRRVCALLGQDDTQYRTGDALPRGWHFILFTPTAPQPSLNRDGTPAPLSASDIPPGFPRRMMGGRRFTFLADIPIGANVRKVSEVIASNEKSGKSGRFLVRTTRQLIYVDGRSDPVLQEDMDTLFREAASAEAAKPATASAPEPRKADHRETVKVDETMLFRYSACTFNAHRIHYDYPYTTGVEKYPALVVNAGVSVLLLRELGIRLSGMMPRTMSTRNGAPLYCGTEITLCAKTVDGGINLWAENAQGQVCAEVELRS